MRTRSTKGVSKVRWYTEDDTAIAGKDYEASEVSRNGSWCSTKAKKFSFVNDIALLEEMLGSL